MADFTSSEPDSESLSQPSVAVVIAAYNVAETIGQAVTSALAQRETSEVIVVDDASKDETAAVAIEAAGNDRRLLVIRNKENAGPAKSRNIAIAMSKAPYIAVLDGDDFYLPGRFKQMFAQTGWDFCADNIVFFKDLDQIDSVRAKFNDKTLLPLTMNLKSFISGNIPNAKRPRGELGFLKPVMRRSFLAQHNLSYAEDCRLGEDFLFYIEALAKGAVYIVVPQCGYAALVRENSLSGRHSLDDLSALHRREVSLIGCLAIGAEERALLVRRARSTLRKIHHREVLAIKAEGGTLKGIASGLIRPTSFIDIVNDRFGKIWTEPAAEMPRALLLRTSFLGA